MTRKTLLLTVAFCFVGLFMFCSDPVSRDDPYDSGNNDCDPTLSFGRGDSVEAVSQVHRSILVTWFSPRVYLDTADTASLILLNDSVEISYYQVYRSIATVRDTCDQVHADTAAANFQALRHRAYVAPGDTSLVDVIDLPSAAYWYGVKAVLADDSEFWVGYDSAIVRNVYEYHPYMDVSSLEMLNVYLPNGFWAAPGFPYDTTGFPYWVLDFEADSLADLVSLVSCDSGTGCGSYSATTPLENGSFGLSADRDTLFLSPYSISDSIVYLVEYQSDGSLNLARASSDTTAITAVLDTVGPLYKGPFGKTFEP